MAFLLYLYELGYEGNNMYEQIHQILKDTIYTLYNISIDDNTFDTPPKKELGDIAFETFPLAKILKTSPILIAEEITKNIDISQGSTIKKISTSGPYINIEIDPNIFLEDFISLYKKEDYLESLKVEKEKTIIVDYIGANVGKPMHIGHMCTPNQGQVFINIFRKLGYRVIADSHIGDWGIIFGKLIVAYKKYGDEKKLQEDAVEHLFELYVQISRDAKTDESLDSDFRQAFRKLSSGDQDSIELWKEFTKYSIDSMNILLSRLNILPDYDIGESFYEGIGLPKMQNYPDLQDSMKDIVRELIKKGIATKNDDGSVGIIFSEDMGVPSVLLQKRDGTHGYFASDLACVKYRIQNWNPERILYFVDARQQLHLKQVFIVSKLAGWVGDKTELTHAFNGFISLKDGAMSTREGRIIKLGDLLDEAELRATKIIKEKKGDDFSSEIIAKQVGIGAIKYGYLKKNRENDVVFDWDEFMSFEGNSGPYIQYGYVRAKKILREFSKTGNTLNIEEISLSETEEKQILTHFLEFENVIQEISENYYAYKLCNYIFELTKRFSALYNTLPILKEEDSRKKYARITILEVYTRIIEISFDVLAIDLPDEM